jgi:uncharacterized protein
MREWMMRRILWIVLGVFLWPQPVPAQAVAQTAPLCAGTDLLAQMQAGDPAVYAALFERAHAVANPHGKFWRVSRDGTAPSYLFGTYHDTEIARQPLDPMVAGALEAARLMLVEVTEEEQARMKARIASDPGFITDADAPGLSRQLSVGERAAAENMLAERGVTLAIADRLRPWMLFSLISVPQCVLTEMKQGRPTLDALLMSAAAGAGIPIAGMETYQQAIDALAAVPAETMNEILLETLRDFSGEEDTRRTALGLYQSGEIAAIWEFSILAGAETIGMARSREIFAQIGASLIDARNRAWVRVLAPELELGGVFAAFGALHLPGAAGVIELLRARGFEVTRLDG